MHYIAGIDIGNSSTEVAVLRRADDRWEFVATSLFRTTGLKGTTENVPGIVNALRGAADRAGIALSDLDLLLLNEAAPVIGDVAMETITETVVTESTMIGHDPSTPGGVGIGRGTVLDVDAPFDSVDGGSDVILAVPGSVDFAIAASRINEWWAAGFDVEGAILERDDGVLVANRLDREIPIVDEVSRLEDVPRGQPAAVEVAPEGRTVQELSNPYGIATLFDLSPEETRKVIPVARALVGNKSAVVIKTPRGDVEERSIPAGTIRITDRNGNTDAVDTEDGAGAIMDAVGRAWPIMDVTGESGTNVGGMLNRARAEMAEITDQDPTEIRIRDLLAVDTLVPTEVKGAVADEFTLESAVGVASMVKTSRLPLRQIADALEERLDVEVRIQGVEATMAVLGALTTPGTDFPLAILDIGGGSTDAAYMNEDQTVDSIHLAGAGDMVTMLIDSELGLDDRELAEAIKVNPLATVQTLYSVQHESGSVEFLDEPVPPELFGRVVLLRDDGSMDPIVADHDLRTIREVRREAKSKVFVENARRALELITPTRNVRHLPFVVMVGRSALDFEIPEMISDALAEYGIVCGRGNVRGGQGPRNAVATGLALSHIDGGEYVDLDAGFGGPAEGDAR
ncbi:diol dehydratase reactivase subunit alpha [Halomarina pelagica]|uniref:diol dehydratase reactivase subunit alpha n=1 Tax=Halomarina pelagica TaxID=2961599 RepID=UPI0020C23974|nr:diol dehydratase reactivase subunit alpha [Halomarina sp. BND7]